MSIEALPMGTYLERDQEPLDAEFIMHRLFGATNRDALNRDHVNSNRGIAMRAELGASRALIAALPALEIISISGVGYDAVDVETCCERGIRVTNTPGVLPEDVADFGVSMMLAQARGVVGSPSWVRSCSPTKRLRQSRRARL